MFIILSFLLSGDVSDSSGIGAQLPNTSNGVISEDFDGDYS